MIENEFPAPIRVPFGMDVGRQGQPPEWWWAVTVRGVGFIRIVMRRQAVSGAIGIVIEIHVALPNVGKRFHVIRNARQ